MSQYIQQYLEILGFRPTTTRTALAGGGQEGLSIIMLKRAALLLHFNSF